ncbi:MAG: HlyC/CorC family transporter [Lachnospiraceae bacterium]|nr:HlyC/CorC family transporter [Lachnospiraceae bacterium]
MFIMSAYFALTETAISSVSKNKIKVSAERGDGRAKRTLYVLDHFDDAITTLLICTNIAHIVAASLMTVIVTRRWGLSAVTLSTFLVTLAMFFFGEMLPKSIGKKASEKVSLSCSGLLFVLMKILRPFSALLSGIGNLTARSVKSSEEYSVTEDELYEIIEDMAEEGSIDEEQGELISSALQFADVTVSSILTPRVDVAAADISDSPEEILHFITGQNHSRILVYEKTIDNVIGVLQIRKFLKQYVKTKKIPSVRPLLDEVYYAHQSTEIDELLDEMTRRKLNMAVVTDSYGGTLGVVTVEDILEEIVGEIWDEDDVIRDPIVEITKDVYLVNGDETVQDTFDYIGFETPQEEEDEERFTNLLMADWVCETLGRIPARGDSFSYYNLTVLVNEVVHNRILKIRVDIDREEEEEKP